VTFLGLILTLFGIIFGVSLLWTVGLLLLVTGLVLRVLGPEKTGREWW